MRNNCAKAAEAEILAAHVRGDCETLSRLYEKAATEMLCDGQSDSGAFYLTQAYVFALESEGGTADRIRGRLVALGRETEA